MSLEAAQMAGAANLVAKVLHDEKSREKADELMRAAADRASCAVLEHRRALIALTDALCDQDELSGDEVHSIVANTVAV